MLKFYVFYRTRFDNRAPESPHLIDYQEAGEFYAPSRGELARLYNSADLKDVPYKRALVVGDLIKDEQDQYFVLTKRGVWASVLPVEEPDDGPQFLETVD